jgi:hypothetical protein
MRTIIHDWDDDKALEILKNLVPALAPDSRILIDDMVLPNTGVHWFPAALDIHSNYSLSLFILSSLYAHPFGLLIEIHLFPKE